MSSSREPGEGTGHDGQGEQEVRDEDSVREADVDDDQALLERHEAMNAILPNVAPRPKRPATYEDLKLVPDHMVAEILDGELIATPRPASPHARAASILLTDLVGPFDRDKGGPGGPGGWWLLAEPELHLHGDVVVPDVAGWRRERMPVMRSVPAFELPPDWICEVLSPRTVRHDRRQKMRIYARERVTYLWFVEPVERTLEVYRLEGTRWTTAGAFGDDEKVRAEPFGEIELDLTRWWLAGPPIEP